MKQDIYFMPLGGGQRVGASCYYLRIGDANLILDAGIGKELGMEFEPDFHALVTSPFVQCMNQVNQIFISHAHQDHIGCLLKLMSQASRADVYMTELTSLLSEFQLYDRVYTPDYKQHQFRSEDERLATKALLDKVAAVSYMQTMDFGKYKVTFFPAGHIPGAMMMLFEVGRRKILYTGDYSLEDTSLTSGCWLPDNLEIDTVIMCGLHAKHPNYTKKTDTLFKTVSYVLKYVEERQQSVMCYVPQLSKGIEFIKTLNKWNVSGVKIYIDSSVAQVISKMEQLSIPIMEQNNRIMGKSILKEPHIYVTANPAHSSSLKARYYRNVKVDFSLHEDFGEMRRFIKKINPRQVILVHCAKEYSPFDATIEQNIMLDGDCRTQFIFAQEKELYKI